MNRIEIGTMHRSDFSFYCRHDNRVVPGCPRGTDIVSCPLRNECPAARVAAVPPETRPGPLAV